MNNHSSVSDTLSPDDQYNLISWRYHRLLDYCGAFALRNGTSPAGALLLEDVPIELLEALHDLSRQPQIEPINNTDADFFAAYNDTKAPTAVLPALPRPPCLFQTPAAQGANLNYCGAFAWMNGTQPIGSLLYEDAPIELLDMLHDLSRQPRPQPTPKKNDRQPAIDM
ncbi:unnamed protein product, partial [Mesorhabditis spiculigera]